MDHGLVAESEAHALSMRRWLWGMLACTLIFVLCILLTVTPLLRMPQSLFTLSIEPGSWLGGFSAWLPENVGFTYQPSSASIEFFALIVLACLCYLGAAWFTSRQPARMGQVGPRGLVWGIALLVGLIYVLTPALLSHDMTVYAGYSRLLAVYHVNPYFVPMISFPHDPITAVDDWRDTVSAYGPLWMLVCGVLGWFLHPDPTSFVLGFRLLALAIHLWNTWLVGRILQQTGRSPRTVTLGMLLYAWNPLVVLESSLGGHNDGFMMSFVLLGILLAARAERRGSLLRGGGVLPTVLLTLGVLVKFTALPILGVYLLWLACAVLRQVCGERWNWQRIWEQRAVVVRALLWPVLAGIGTGLLGYGPFWIGHSFAAIAASFQRPPSAQFSENSFMRTVGEWVIQNPDQRRNPVLAFLRLRPFWDIVTYLAILTCVVLGALRLWRRPLLETFVAVALATMCAVLLVTPWFFPWYIIWLVGLAVLCLPVWQSRLRLALLALTLTFSFSALLTYLANNGVFGPFYYITSFLTTIPPACAFLFTLVLWRTRNSQATGGTSK